MTRTRDKSTISYGTWTMRDIIGKSSTTNSGAFSVLNHDIMRDEVTPRFKQRSKDGEIFIKPMTKHTSVASLERCNFWKQRNRPGDAVKRFEWSHEVGSAWQDYMPLHTQKVQESVERLQHLAITAAYSRVGSPDVSTLTELAELRETISFLYSPVRKMIDITRRLRSHLNRVQRIKDSYQKRLAKWESLPPHVKKRRKQPEPPVLPKRKLGKLEMEDVSSSWLAYRYAIMPLIYTFEDIQKHLTRSAFPDRDTARKKESVDIDLSEQGTWQTHSAPNGTIEYRPVRSGKVNVVVRAGVLYKPDWTLNRQLGLQIHRIPVAMYEVIPLSFVTDWFHNGMEYYDALTAELRAVKIHGAWVTTELDYQYTVSYELRPGDSETTVAPGGITFKRSGKWKERKLASLSDVKLMLRLELNGKRVADGLALIHTMLATARKKHG